MQQPGRQQIIATGKHLRLVKQGTWEYAERTVARGAVVIVAVTAEGKLLLTEQYRIPVNSRVLELPAGLVGDVAGASEEDWGVAAQRELLEETGYRARRMVAVTPRGPISAGFGTEILAFYRGSGLTRIAEGGGIDDEQIRVHEIRVDRVPAWLRKKAREGVLIDPKIYAGLYFAGQ